MTEFAQVLMSISQANGVTTDRSYVFLDELAKFVATGSASPVAIGTGRALVYGTWYENDAGVNVVIPTPAASTRIDRIVARKSWAAQTVRITRIAGTEGAGAPAITQVAGTTWDMPICQVSITTGGVITITDERDFLQKVRGCKVYNNAAQAIPNSTTTQVNFNAERFDTDGYHDNVTDNTRITIPASLGGLYLFTAHGWWLVGETDTGVRHIHLRKNAGVAGDTGSIEPIEWGHNGSGTVSDGLHTTVLFDMAPGDYMEVYVDQVSGAPLDLIASTATIFYGSEFACVRLGQL